MKSYTKKELALHADVSAHGFDDKRLRLQLQTLAASLTDEAASDEC